MWSFYTRFQLHLTELEDCITEEQKFTIVRVEN